MYRSLRYLAITGLALALPVIAFAAPTSSTVATTEWSYDYAAARVTLGSEFHKKVKYKESDIVNLFLVRNDRLYENDKWTKNTKTNDYKIWEMFAAIAGKEFVREHIWRYATYKDPEEGVLAFVQLIKKEKPLGWGLAFNANASNFENEKWVRDTASILIHEYTHVLTLNRDQFDHKRIKAAHCKERYLSSIGCAQTKSYLNAYVAKFWTAKDLAKKQKASTYYKKHQDDFVTSYGATDPEEDIAESFTQFVLGAKPTENLKKKDQKVLFFYEYPELVERRTDIRAAVASYFQ